MLCHGHPAELRERRFEIVQFQSIRPVILVRGAQNLENFEDLVDLGVSHEKWPTLDHFREDAACGPQIDTKTVCFLPEQDLWAPIPECNDLVRVRFDWQTKGSCQTEVRQLDVLSLGVDQQVLWLEIPMENPMLVQINQRLQNLVEKQLRLLFGQWLVALLLHVLFQVVFEVLKDQVQLVLTIDDLFQPIGRKNRVKLAHGR